MHCRVTFINHPVTQPSLFHAFFPVAVHGMTVIVHVPFTVPQSVEAPAKR